MVRSAFLGWFVGFDRDLGRQCDSTRSARSPLATLRDYAAPLGKSAYEAFGCTLGPWASAQSAIRVRPERDRPLTPLADAFAPFAQRDASPETPARQLSEALSNLVAIDPGQYQLLFSPRSAEDRCVRWSNRCSTSTPTHR